MDFFNDIGKRLSDAARSVQEKTRDGVELTRISNELRTLAGELEHLYGALGRAYFDAQAAGDPDPAILAPFIEKIDAALAQSNTLSEQRDKLRQQRRCPSCNAIQPLSARFCSACGSRLPVQETPAEEPAAAEEYCPECGALRKKDAQFCNACGHRYGEETAAAEPQITWPGKKPDLSSADEEPQEKTQE